jgi:trehalose 6-phosphate phosphatase
MMHDLPKPPEGESGWAWFLDLDGTLVPIAPTPLAVQVPEELPGILMRLSERVDGAVAMVSGRTLDAVRGLLAPFDPPVAGLHGIECRDAGGTVHRLNVPDGIDAIRARLTALANEHQGLLLEDKGAALALHYRQAPQLEPVARHAVDDLLAAHPGFTVLAGKMVFEVKPQGADKGSALRTFMAQAPFAGRRPVFVGDDVTDEYGFTAANEMGGLSVLVGPMRDTAATYRLEDIEECWSWLARAGGTVWSPRTGEGAD